MRRATTVLVAGSWDAAQAADSVLLGYDDRFRRRLRIEGRSGTVLLLDLPEARHLRDGDGLRLDDGALILVTAAPEPLTEVRAEPALLMRLAWHIGNRHLPAMLAPDRILIRRDHVIAAMLRGLGGEVRDIDGPFDPEGGAYSARAPQHDHGHSHDHGHHHHGHSHD
jgi:urease accessory protein